MTTRGTDPLSIGGDGGDGDDGDGCGDGDGKSFIIYMTLP